MKKFLLMFAAVAAIAFVGCKTETKPAEEVVEEPAAVEYTVDGVAADLMNCADEAAAVSLLDGIKAKAEELLNAGDQAGYFNIINILKTVWENNKEALLAKIPTLAEKMTGYIEVPDALKAAITLMEANPDRLVHHNGFNVASMSFAPETIFAEIKKHRPDFEMEYDVDPLKQSIAESWPDRMDDTCARREWGWAPNYDIRSMTTDMLEKLSKKLLG